MSLPLLAALTTLGCTSSEPNVLLIVLDTSRQDHFQSYGYERATSPNIQSLGERGAVFEQAHVHTGWTGPSMASLMTSMVPRDHGLIEWEVPLAEQHTTLAEVLGGHGYQTMAVVSHFVFQPELGFDQGFSSYDISVLDKGSPHRTHTSKEVTNKALATLKERDRSKPFFMWAHYFDPHAEYLEHEAFDYGARPIDRYDGEMAYTDKHIGRLLEQLDERGELDNTWIVLTADHGEEFRDHGGTQHRGTLYEELVSVPLIVVGPGVEPQRVSSVVPNSDIAPTLLELLELPPQSTFTGQAMPLVEGRFRFEDRPVYMEVERHGNKRALLEGRLKLIRDLEAGTSQLFDLSTDPGEKTNVSSRYPEEFEAMGSKLDAWFASGTFQAETREISAAERKKLELLGYLDPEEPEPMPPPSEEAAAP